VYCNFFTRRTLSTVEVLIIEAEQMEIFAIVVLGLSVFVGFSTSARKPKIQSDRRREEDPDWAFTEAYDSDESREKV